ncbi:MAG: rhomboid family intramembrane serine protease [Candidatus Nanohaloarchaea archaeon]
MAECSYCGKASMSFTCRYCGEKFCAEHRLPENHDCEGLEEGVEEEREEAKKWFKQRDVKQETVHGEPKTQRRRRPSLLNDIKDTFKNSATMSIIAVTVVAFLMQLFVPGFSDFIVLSPALTAAAVEATNSAFSQTVLNKTLVQSPWTLFTVMIAHGGLFHIFANMVTFYFFGTTMERVVGAKELLKFYIGAGLAASLGYVLFRNVLFQLYGASIGGAPTLGPAVGASGAVVATVGVVAMLYPKAEVLLYFFIPMKIKTAVYIFAGMEAVNMAAKLAGTSLPVIGMFASSAHLAGLAVGLWYGKKLQDRYRQNKGVLDLFGY